METEVKTIMTVDTARAVDNLASLKQNVDGAKEALAAYQKQQKLGADVDREIAAATAVLKDATSKYNETLSFTAKAVGSADGSFNALNARLGELKVAWKAATDETERASLTRQINDVKSEINGMNESIGNFQHNVGNYKSAFDGLGNKIKLFGDGLKAAKGGTEGLSASMKALSVNPLVAILGIVVSLFTQLKDRIGETEDGTKALNSIMAAGKKVLEPITKLVEWLGAQLGKVGEWFTAHAPQITGFLQRIIPTIAGVGNTLLQGLLTPIRATIEAVKGLGKVIGDVFRGDWSKVKEDARAAANGIGDAFRNGFSFKANFEEGRETGVAFAARLGSEDAKKAAQESGAAVADAFAIGLAEVTDSDIFREKTLTPLQKWAQDMKKLLQGTILEAMKDMDAELVTEAESVNAEIDDLFNAFTDTMVASAGKQKYTIQESIAMYQQYSKTVSSALSAVADVMESNADGTERSAEQVKAVRIAAATIDTISGAVGAFASAAANPGGIPGMIIGAANAATITAMGIANIAKIRSTTVSKGSTNANSLTGPAMISSSPQYVNAPTYTPQTQEVRNITSASEEALLNQPIKAYILSSDLEADRMKQEIRREETQF